MPIYICEMQIVLNCRMNARSTCWIGLSLAQHLTGNGKAISKSGERFTPAMEAGERRLSFLDILLMVCPIWQVSARAS
jgi:hypothetical protein